MARNPNAPAPTEELEREYVIPLRASMHQPSRRRRSGHALETVRRFISRHMKGKPEDVWIDPRINLYIWERGIQHIPRQVHVKAIRFEDGLIEVDLLDEA
ncbi:MAG: 50S ribosomal protein L31e [Thermoplasmata archaeon]|jgi:large subunit ribosomal protein L31e|nr:50S ribosomal protein L31e [Thermoplasmata archaeon]